MIIGIILFVGAACLIGGLSIGYDVGYKDAIKDQYKPDWERYKDRMKK